MSYILSVAGIQRQSVEESGRWLAGMTNPPKNYYPSISTRFKYSNNKNSILYSIVYYTDRLCKKKKIKKLCTSFVRFFCVRFVIIDRILTKISIDKIYVCIFFQKLYHRFNPKFEWCFICNKICVLYDDYRVMNFYLQIQSKDLFFSFLFFVLSNLIVPSQRD